VSQHYTAHHEHIGLSKRLRLASHFVYHVEGGWLNALLNLVGLIALIGLFNALVIDEFLRWVGHPPMEPQPSWFTLVCTIALPAVILLDYLIFSVKSPDLPHKNQK
jgi:hypothetical protein